MAGLVVRSDAGIVAGIVRGDDEAVETLFRRFFRPLVGWVRVRCRDADLAEDVAQEALVRFIGAAGTFDVERAVWPYLTTVAKHVLVDQLRRRREEIGLDRFAAVLGDVEPDAGAEVVSALWLDEVLAGLPDRQQVAVDLRYRRGWANDDAAAFLGLSNTAFRQLLFRARQNLRDVIRTGGPAALVHIPAGRLRDWWRDLGWRLRFASATSSSGWLSAGAEGFAGVLVAVSLGLATLTGGATPERSTAMSPVSMQGAASRSGAFLMEQVNSSAGHLPDTDTMTWSAAESSTARTDHDSTTRVVLPQSDAADTRAEVEVGEDDEQWSVESDVSAELGGIPISSQGQDVAVDCRSMVGPILCADEAEVSGGGALLFIGCDGAVGEVVCTGED